MSLEPQGEKLFAQLKTDAVARITVTDPKGKLEVAKEGGSWKVTAGGKTFDASKTAIETLLKNFADVRERNVVTSNKDAWKDFNVDDANAVRIVLSGADGAALADCFFGKGGTTSFSQYARLSSSPDVVQTDVRVEKTTSLKEWAELRLFPESFYVDDVERILFKSALLFNDQGKTFARNLSMTFVPGEKNKEGYATWKLVESERFPLSPQKMSNFVNAIVGLTADDVVPDPEKLKLDPAHPAGSVAVRLKSGQTRTLSLLGVVAGDPASFYITNQDAKYIYTASNWTLRAVFADASTLLDVEAALTGGR